MNCSICGSQVSEKVPENLKSLGVSPGQSYVELRTSMDKTLIREVICTKCVGLTVHALFEREEAKEKFLDFLRIAIGYKKEASAGKDKEEPVGMEALYRTDVEGHDDDVEGIAEIAPPAGPEDDPSRSFVAGAAPRQPSIEEELASLREGDVFTEEMMQRMIRGS